MYEGDEGACKREESEAAKGERKWGCKHKGRCEREVETGRGKVRRGAFEGRRDGGSEVDCSLTDGRRVKEDGIKSNPGSGRESEGEGEASGTCNVRG